jgi:hypothetical protein
MGQELALLSGKLETESLGKLDNPWAMEYLPDGRLLITEKPGSSRLSRWQAFEPNGRRP